MYTKQFDEIDPSQVIYIKLGSGGRFEEICIENGYVRLGFGDPFDNRPNEPNYELHELCKQNDPKAWERIRQTYLDKGKSPQTASWFANQTKAFYQADANALWITFHNNLLWWCFSDQDVELKEQGDKHRYVLPEWQWRSIDINGDLLVKNRLIGNILAIQNFRSTLFEIKDQRRDYIVNKINGVRPPYIKAAEDAQDGMIEISGDLIKKLHDKDFEIFVDLVFSNAGWRRLNRVGGTTKTLDMEYYSPFSQLNCAVQVKSSSSKQEFKKYCRKFMEDRTAQEFYYVVHSSKGDLEEVLNEFNGRQGEVLDETEENFKITLVTLDVLSRWAVDFGLTDWLVTKAGFQK